VVLVLTNVTCAVYPVFQSLDTKNVICKGPDCTVISGPGPGGGGGGGGGGGSPSANNTVSAKTGDITGDNKIDAFDFNLVMVNWGKVGVNLVADLDKNGKVDILDFNMLMINWTR
jgi:hypothetical protein